MIIENINAAAKRFRILKNRLPNSLFPLADLIAKVCYHLTSFLPTLRKKTAADVTPRPSAAAAASAEEEDEPDVFVGVDSDDDDDDDDDDQ